MTTTTVDAKDAALDHLRAVRATLKEREDALEDARESQGAAAVAAIEAGATYEEVGDALGLSKQRAHDLVKAARDG